jgi:hypothetical protein
MNAEESNTVTLRQIIANSSELGTRSQSVCRFHVVVYNCDRIESFTNNFEKIVGFDALKDMILILDCSHNPIREQQQLVAFARENGWRLGQEVHFVKRRNWGIDQGARIDYFNLLRHLAVKPKYIWQFQEHYLDTVSEWSHWPWQTVDLNGNLIGGQIKSDTIPDGLRINLDVCEEIYERYPHISVLYADRNRIGIFPYDDKEWFYVDGANFSARTSYVLEVLSEEVLKVYSLLYDGGYQWALFIELNIGHQLTTGGGGWYDLVTQKHFDSPQALMKLENEHEVPLHQIAEKHYDQLYKKYKKRCSRLGRANIVAKKLYTALFRLQNMAPVFSRIRSRFKSFLPN